MNTEPTSSEPTEATAATPLLRVVKGEPTAEQLAALIAVVAARASAGGSAPAAKPRSEWGHPARLHRPPLRIGPGAWRASAW